MSLVEPTTSSNITVAIRRSDGGAARPLTSSTLCSQTGSKLSPEGHTRLARPQDVQARPPGTARRRAGSPPRAPYWSACAEPAPGTAPERRYATHRSASRPRCTPSPLPGWRRSARAGRLGGRRAARRSPGPSRQPLRRCPNRRRPRATTRPSDAPRPAPSRSGRGRRPAAQTGREQQHKPVDAVRVHGGEHHRARRGRARPVNLRPVQPDRIHDGGDVLRLLLERR